MPERRLLTLHAPLGRLVAHQMLGAVQTILEENDIKRWWVSPAALPDVLLMVDVPEDSDLAHQLPTEEVAISRDEDRRTPGARGRRSSDRET